VDPVRGLAAAGRLDLEPGLDRLVVDRSDRSVADLHDDQPAAFSTPASTKNWASKGVFGERIWADRKNIELPEQFRSTRIANTTYLFQVAGLAVLILGLVKLDVTAVIAGLVIVQCAKAWFIDRMVLLFDDMKTHHSEYADWES
jgi:uncharacterized protein DUF6653